jgi:hypothetical protein
LAALAIWVLAGLDPWWLGLKFAVARFDPWPKNHAGMISAHGIGMPNFHHFAVK